jgi:hypothetical protein
MSLVERYIAEVGRHLPEKDRSDIEAEIRSMLEDMIEERAHSSAKPADEKIMIETLEQLGDPQLLASKYSPSKRYLIGPDWYEGYVKVLQRVLFTALPIFAVVTFILQLTKSPLDFMAAVGGAVNGAFNVGVQILFWVTLVFVFLERSDAKPDELHEPNSRAWTVAKLPKLPKKRQISIAETVMNIVWILFILIWIALPFFIGRMEENPDPVPFFHPNLWSFWLPLFFAIMGFTLVHELFKLKIGNWTPTLTATNVILCLVSIIYIAALVTTQDLVNPAFLDNSPGSLRLRETITWSIDITAAVLVGTYVWSMVDSIRKSRQLKQKS